MIENLIQKEDDGKKNLSAKIHQINNLGLMTIRFNTTMKTEIINKTFINETLLDIYLDPALNRHVEDQIDLS